MDGSFSAKDDDSNSSSSGYSGGGGGSGGGFSGEHEEPACAAPENGGGSLAVPSFLHTVPAAESMLSPTTAAAAAQITAGASSSSSPQKRSGRRSVQKRVVSIPITEAEGSRAKGGGSDGGGAPPSDSWAWRKYGQKPIKGSPYPRGYYRCSSSKGCPARKQVERSRADPSMLVITYACEHNHPWPLPKNQQQQQQQQQKEGIHRRQPPAAAGSPSKPASAKQEPEAIVSPPPPATSSLPSSAGDGQIFAADLSLTMMADEFGWFSDVSTSPPAGDAFLGGPIGGDGALMIPPASDQEADDFTGSEGGAPPEEEEALFAGLGELPECAVVFRRGFLDRRIRMQIDGKDDRLVWRMREKDLEIERERERGCVAASR